MKARIRITFILIYLSNVTLYAQNIIVGAEQFSLYDSLIRNKQVGLVVNQTSVVENEHLLDFLLSRDIDIVKIFSPEHGFRGTADAGMHLDNSLDERTGIPIISLYGSNRKPTEEQLKNLEVVVFDIQDVGVRFYTYISTMQLMMEACAENNIPLIILDRPNPNGEYVDGPVLRKGFESFVGMDCIPVVYGLTVGELAGMINGEHWLPEGEQCRLKVIPVENYNHKMHYSLPIKPSPNLPNDLAVRLYPSLCFFEGTMMSVGRGTDFPFQVVGYPDMAFGRFRFMPESKPGASDPKYKDQLCYGKDFRELIKPPGFTINYVMEFYYKSGRNPDFFTDYFDKLAGNSELKQQIIAGLTEEEIRISWLEELNEYKLKRKKYLLYPDFDN